MFAKAFLYSLDGIGKALTALTKVPGVPGVVVVQRDQFYRMLPDLTGVRDTSHHLEDRVQWLDRNRKKLTPMPVMNDAVHAPDGGVLILNSLNDNRFGCTMNNGEFGEVEVSVETTKVAQLAIQGILDAFSWKGPRRYEPFQ